ncbi:MAG: MarR family transcriptional regulator [Myxococcales bacterium FL481]|nr:MAG: MarR family transcriptional regulator [Myxococcales bacterium FL481]
MPASARLARVHAAIEALQRLSELFITRRVALAREVGLTEQQWRVLEEISTERFMPSMFARQRQSSAAAVSKTLRQLLDKELVVAAIRPGDGRQRHYTLSPAGERTLRELRRLRQVAVDTIWADLSETSLLRFAHTATQIADAIEAFHEREHA